MFDFDYRIECYTPEAKRKYGYFTLPMLHRGALVGRVDAKAHRAQGVFEVKALHLQPGCGSSHSNWPNWPAPSGAAPHGTQRRRSW